MAVCHAKATTSSVVLQVARRWASTAPILGLPLDAGQPPHHQSISSRRKGLAMKRIRQLLWSQLVSRFHHFARRRIAAELAETGAEGRLFAGKIAGNSSIPKSRAATRPSREAPAHFAFPSSGSSASLPLIRSR